MAQKYPHRGSYAAFLALSALLFVLVMLVLWFWLRERKTAPVHTSNPQSTKMEVPWNRGDPRQIRSSAPIPS